MVCMGLLRQMAGPLTEQRLFTHTYVICGECLVVDNDMCRSSYKTLPCVGELDVAFLLCRQYWTEVK